MGNVLCCSCSPRQERNDMSSIMVEVPDMDHVDALIIYIDQLISRIYSGVQVQGDQQQVQRPNSVDSGGNLIQKLSRPLQWHVCKKCFLSALDRETRKVVIDVLNQVQPVPYLGMALSVIAHLLERAEQTSSNKDECLRLLRYMSVLVKHMKNLDIHLDRPKLNQILLFIVKETLMCARLIEPETFCRFFSAPLDAADLDKLESDLLHSYPDLQLQALTEILNRLPKYPEPSQGDPDNAGMAVGIEEAQNKVIELLDMEKLSRSIVVIYGVGGIGKTTLATAVFSRLNLTGYHYCRVVMDQDSSKNDLKAIQEQILRDLFKENLKLNNSADGREKLKEAFGKASKPVFLFIDNALRKKEVKELLPIEHLSNLPMQSRILATTRNLDETSIFRLPSVIEFYFYRVAPLSKPEARSLLCHHALGNKNGSFDQGVNMDGLLQICEGIPLVLQIVGSKIAADATACNEIFEYYKKLQQKGFVGGEDHLGETIVDFVYEQLNGSSKEAFLDIAFFFIDWERSEVAAIVGEIELRDLEGAALVTTSEEEETEYDFEIGLVMTTKVKVKMHDIVRARGRELAEGNRITDRESLSILLNDEQKLQQAKGIWLSNEEKQISFEAKHLELMSRYLRVLSLGKAKQNYDTDTSEKPITINGRCERAFEELRFLRICFEDMLPIDPSKAKQLVYFEGQLMKRPRTDEAKFTINLPESLRLLYLYGYYDLPISWSLDTCRHLPPLRELQLKQFTLESLQTCISLGNFSCLKILKLTPTELETIPESFGNLSFLQILVMNKSHLRTLPESFGNLSSLQRLVMKDFCKLELLPESFGNLSSLQTLSMDGSHLITLPESFGNLSSLQRLVMKNCCKLELLPESFGNLSSLQTLETSHCSKLELLPESFGNLSSLQTLYMSDCSKLELLPESFGNLSSLQTLEMSQCSKLELLPESFGNLSSLQILEMSHCSKLELLPESFGNLSSLQTLYMKACEELERLPDRFGNLTYLEELSMKDCKKMCTLSNNFGQLKCLKYLDISNCKELKRLPDNIVCLTSLTGLNASGCADLEAKAMASLIEINSLLFLEMGGSPMLIKRWEEIQQHRPLIGAGRRLEPYYYPYEEIMSPMLFNGGSRFLQLDGEGQLVEVASEVEVKVGLLLTACNLSKEVGQKLVEVASQGFQIIYLDVDVEAEAEASSWIEEREKRIRETLLQLPQGSRAWTSRFRKTTLLLAFSLWRFTHRAETSIVGTSVVVDEEGRRKISIPLEKIFRSDDSDSRRIDLRTLLSPLDEALSYFHPNIFNILMGYN